LGIRRLADWDLDGVAQMPNNALGVAMAGAGLALMAFRKQVAARVLAGFAAAIALATLFEHATGIDIGIDTLILYPTWGQTGTVAPGRMGLPGSITLAVIGLSIVCATFASGRRIATGGALVVISVAALSVIGYWFGASPLYAIPRLTSIALQTSTLMLALGIALIAAIPEGSLMRLLRAPSGAGALMRRTLPAVVLLPLLLGWLRLQGHAAHLFDVAFGTALLVMTLIGVLVAMAWSGANIVAGHEAALRENRDRLAGILGSITDAFLTVDRAWQTVFANDAARALLARRELMPDPESRSHLERSMQERVAVEFETLDNPLQRWIAYRAYPTADGGLAIYLRDVTERKEAEQALRKSATALVAADRMKDEFLATLSHELRTPLTAIVGWSEILMRTNLEPDERRLALDTIRSSARAQAQLVDDVLDVSRIVTGKMRLHRAEANLADAIEDAVKTVRPAAEAKRIALRVNADRTLPPVLVDAERIRQVVWNLLSNAIKFSRPGTAVDIELRGERESVVIVVTDEGPGIAPSFLPHVFERFRQADSSTSRSHSGLGIGLALSKDLVELHGGTITAESTLDEGSRFAVRLPAPRLQRSGSPEETPPPSPAPLQGLRVLYVDDREDARHIIGTILRQAGAEVAEAESVDGALSALMQVVPQVVVTDLAMPGRDGYDLLSAIRADERWRHVPVLALTAQARIGDEARAAGAGFERFLRKPIESEELTSAIAGAVGNGSPRPQM
jgi:signal transduction histidine kinase/ActR/RegA family two-component response regulator